VHPKCANSMAASWLISRNDLVGTGRAISILFGINGGRSERSHLVGPPFPAFKACFSAMAGWHFSGDLSRHLLLLVGVVRVPYLLRMAEITSGSGFEPNNPTDQICLRVLEIENDLEKQTRTIKS